VKTTSQKKKMTRQEQRDLDIEISFVEGVVKRDPKYVEALRVLGDGYTRRGRVEEGLKVDERLARLRPDDPETHYSLACSYALAKKIEPAFTALSHAIELGYHDSKWLRKDPDLANLRKSPFYKKVLAKLNVVQVHVK
jgi:Flp pilus assembly protein TadD